jgi:hypothetical protein
MPSSKNVSTWSTIAVSDMASAVGSAFKSAFRVRASSDILSFLVVVSSAGRRSWSAAPGNGADAVQRFNELL